jgi:glucokinase
MGGRFGRALAKVAGRANMVCMDPSSQLIAGVDLGGTKIQTVVVAGPDVAGQSRHLTPRTNAADVMTEIIATLHEALSSAGKTPGDLAAIGIGTPGSVDQATGHVSQSSNVPGFMEDVPLGPTVSGAFGGVKVVVDNDVRVAVMGEFRRGAGRPFRNLLGVFVGTGVGGGLVINGALYPGRGTAGEIGHTTVYPGGRKCPCGRLGCLEAYAGRLALEDEARAREHKGHHTKLFEIMEKDGKDRVSSAVWATALDRGDHMTVELIHEAVVALGIAISNAQNLLDLEAIILGGGLGDRLGEPFIRRVEEHMRTNLRRPDQPPVFLGTELGDLSGAVGAAVVAGA